MLDKETFIDSLNNICYCIDSNDDCLDDVTYVKNNIQLLSMCGNDALRSFINEMLLKDNIAKSLKILIKTGVLFFAFPELEKLVELKQPVKYHDYDAFDHTMEAVKYSEKNLVLRLAMLLHDVGKSATYHQDENGKITFYGHPAKGEKMAFKMLSRLGYDKNVINEVCMYIRHHMDYAPTEKSFNKMLKELGNDVEKVNKLLKVKLYDSYASRGIDHELANNARSLDAEFRKFLDKYKR